MIGIFIIVTILCTVIAGLSVFLYFKSDRDKKEYQHEAEMKELEFLYENNKKEWEGLISEYEVYITNYQAYYHNIVEIIRMTDQKLKDIDTRGVFSSDDEIGFFFKNVLELQDLLNGFDFNKPVIKNNDTKEYKEDPILPNGKSNVIVITQKEAEEIASKIK